ncbi:hypothetical protein ACIB24_05945 [Spongisporangium articulatum]|uniref:Uncharacterized protein n=1 Tax=Spongisporangium articulatum TaxID=3362603 RepID=A0ABW8AJQ2_9ACTN
MTAISSAVVSAVCAVVIAVAAFVEGPVIVVAGAVCVLAIALGWGDVLHLPARAGTTFLVAAVGVGGLIIAYQQAPMARPLSLFPALLAVAVLSAFAHELLRRDGRTDLVESVTGTLSGQVIAVQAAGWLLLLQTGPGRRAVLVAAVAVVAARVVGSLPLPVEPVVTAWAGIGSGTAAALLTSAFTQSGIPPLTAMALGAGVAGAGLALDRLLVDPHGDPPRLTGVLAWGAAPVATAGTIAYAIVRIALS